MRVDWSKNLVNNYAGLFFFEDVTVEPVSFWESDPGKPEAIHLERADAARPRVRRRRGQLLRPHQQAGARPPSRRRCASPTGSASASPTCFLSYHLADCADSIVKVRHAFAKMSPKHDYEPRKWDGKQMELFGLWDIGLNRLSYNRQYGVTNISRRP